MPENTSEKVSEKKPEIIEVTFPSWIIPPGKIDIDKNDAFEFKKALDKKIGTSSYEDGKLNEDGKLKRNNDWNKYCNYTFRDMTKKFSDNSSEASSEDDKDDKDEFAILIAMTLTLYFGEERMKEISKFSSFEILDTGKIKVGYLKGNTQEHEIIDVGILARYSHIAVELYQSETPVLPINYTEIDKNNTVQYYDSGKRFSETDYEVYKKHAYVEPTNIDKEYLENAKKNYIKLVKNLSETNKSAQKTLNKYWFGSSDGTFKSGSRATKTSHKNYQGRKEFKEKVGLIISLGYSRRDLQAHFRQEADKMQDKGESHYTFLGFNIMKKPRYKLLRNLENMYAKNQENIAAPSFSSAINQRNTYADNISTDIEGRKQKLEADVNKEVQEVAHQKKTAENALLQIPEKLNESVDNIAKSLNDINESLSNIKTSIDTKNFRSAVEILSTADQMTLGMPYQECVKRLPQKIINRPTQQSIVNYFDSCIKEFRQEIEKKDIKIDEQALESLIEKKKDTYTKAASGCSEAEKTITKKKNDLEQLENEYENLNENIQSADYMLKRYDASVNLLIECIGIIDNKITKIQELIKNSDMPSYYQNELQELQREFNSLNEKKQAAVQKRDNIKGTLKKLCKKRDKLRKQIDEAHSKFNIAGISFEDTVSSINEKKAILDKYAEYQAYQEYYVSLSKEQANTVVEKSDQQREVVNLFVQEVLGYLKQTSDRSKTIDHDGIHASYVKINREATHNEKEALNTLFANVIKVVRKCCTEYKQLEQAEKDSYKIISVFTGRDFKAEKQGKLETINEGLNLLASLMTKDDETKVAQLSEILPKDCSEELKTQVYGAWLSNPRLRGIDWPYLENNNDSATGFTRR